ncbi:ECF transporter S component [Cellulosilyticum ruminicola]|uniref:ECF transporter S component n=1 Tax=Cellulosilyticum ruminicola TaxID=425254 RepID=UPI0006CFD3BE|nr:ECF transporter S component [Cellulosilyticum ruminicola]
MNKTRNTKTLTLLGVLIAIQVVLTMANIGLIPLPFIKATILHIPVIIGAVLLGPTEGMILGLSFGIMSIVMNTVQPGVTSFVFSPFITVGDNSGNLTSLFVAIVPRILIGVTAYYSYKLVCKFDKTKVIAYSVAGLVGALTNTILVMGSIYVLFGNQYAAAKEIPFSALFGAIMAIVGTNGVPEAIGAAIIVPALCKPLNMIFRLNTARVNKGRA